MPVIFLEFYTEELVKARPDWWFVFGDNYEKKGRGGQAKACRDQPNAIGWPTKRAPNNLPSSFLKDADFDDWWAMAQPILLEIEQKLRAGRYVVFPEDGLGTGLAKLPENAPKIFNVTNNMIANCVMRFGMVK